MHVMDVGKSGKLLKTPVKSPYLTWMRNASELYLTEISQPWFAAETKMTVNTFVIVTTSANTLEFIS